MKYEVRGKDKANTRLSKAIHQKYITIERSRQLHREILCAIKNAPDICLQDFYFSLLGNAKKDKFSKNWINQIVTHTTEI